MREETKRGNFHCFDCGQDIKELGYYREREIIDYGIGSTWATLWQGYVCELCGGEDWEEIDEEEDLNEEEISNEDQAG